MTATVAGLARSCHPGPTLAVTALAALLAFAFTAPPGVAVLLVLCVFTGQLVIGWSNDVLDAARDRHDGRGD